MEIAKFRAARYLWSKIVNAYGLSDSDNATMFIHCTNTQFNKTVYDPYVNMLRSTTETMSAVLGGIDSMTVLPFNAIFEESTNFSERIARNQQLILKGESYFDKVVDPAAGSYYIENLTNNIIHETWKLFLEVQEKGTYLEAFKQGYILRKIKEEASAKDLEIAQRKRSILGTNQYPNNIEVLLNIDEDIFKETNDTGILKPYRGALEFEKIRYKTDKYAVKNTRPRAWMYTFGNLAMLKARSQFAGNFFGCAGFEIIDNNVFTSLADGINTAKKIKPEIIVICSSDEEYAEIALPIFEALKNESIIVLAGYPVDLAEKLKTAGMANFIHLKSNVIEELKKYQALVGIK
jgi:methylmalonyl-CoA mutase